MPDEFNPDCQRAAVISGFSMRVAYIYPSTSKSLQQIFATTEAPQDQISAIKRTD
jgi:hypothetical protein